MARSSSHSRCRRLLIAGWIATVTAATGAGNSAGADEFRENASDPSAPAIAEMSSTSPSSEVVQGLLRLRDEGPHLWPDGYGDIASGIQGDEDVLVVYLAESNQDLEGQVLDFAGVPVEKVAFRRASMTRVEAEALDARFSADAQNLIAQGYGLISWGIGEGVTYHVTLDASSADDVGGRAAVASYLTERYGPDLVIDFSPAPPVLLNDRAHDNPQWYGGDFLNANRGTAARRISIPCTSGIPLTWAATGNKYILTAGHCYSLTEKIYNGIGNVTGGWDSNLVGSITNRSWNIGYPDAELIGADGSRAMWRGPSAMPPGQTAGTVTIDTLTNPWRGMPLCVDGAYEGQFCGMTVGDPDHSVSAGGNTGIAHQATLTSSNVQAVGQGDSGGPVYATIQGVTYGVGIISSVADGYYSCTNWARQVGGRMCGSTVNIQNIGPVLSMWNLVLDR
jgi:hypothetical protein